MKKKTFLYITISLALILMLSGCKANEDDKEEVGEEAVAVEVERVNKGRIYEELSFVGRVLSETDNAVVPNIPGSVESVEVDVGDEVRPGDLLFTLENEEIEKNLETVNNALNKLEGQRQEIDRQLASIVNTPNAKDIEAKKQAGATIDIDISEDTIDIDIPDKIGEIIEGIENMPSPQEIEAIEELKNAKEKLDEKIAELQMTKKEAESAYENLKVASPGKGVVSYIGVQKGGMALNTEPAILVSNLEKMYIEINVTDKLINKINKNDKARVDIPAVSGKDLDGTIESVSISPDMKSGLYPVRILIEAGEGLKPGMIGKAKLRFNQKDGVIVVDRDVLMERDGEKFVYIEEDGKAVERKVSTGLDTGERVEIKEGLKNEDKLIVKGQNFLQDGARVKVIGGDKK